ncbi:MAG: 50S ribosomal protein L18, partial [Patescibacteria group bacterium]
VSYSDLAISNQKKVGKTETARLVGKALAELAKESKIDKVVFDRGGNKFHGRVKSVADGAREGGLNF